MATKNQISAIHAIKRARGWGEEEYRTALTYYGVGSASDMTFAQARDFISAFGTIGNTARNSPPVPENQVEKSKGYRGLGTAGSPNDHLTQGQADEISAMEKKLKWNQGTTLFWIQKVLNKSCSVEMLMQFEARKLIHVMHRLQVTGKQRRKA
ncbi:hypothetical protein JW777_00775 [bacterium]|nr:hypothetical protein [bacterium]